MFYFISKLWTMFLTMVVKMVVAMKTFRSQLWAKGNHDKYVGNIEQLLSLISLILKTIWSFSIYRHTIVNHKGMCSNIPM
jgi:hypothetical protein